jgi:cupin fold WbuC family metalloprotein
VSEKYRITHPEVLYSEESITTANLSDIDYLKQLSSRNARKRIRLCAHGGTDDRLHEMLIVHERGAYVRPHKHPGKSESTHIIEGLVDVVTFDDKGGVQSIIHMGDYASGRTFYYRMAFPMFHTLIIRSDVLVFHEITNGPFDRRDTVFAPWAPDDNDMQSIKIFMAALSDKVALMEPLTREKT